MLAVPAPLVMLGPVHIKVGVAAAVVTDKVIGLVHPSAVKPVTATWASCMKFCGRED